MTKRKTESSNSFGSAINFDGINIPKRFALFLNESCKRENDNWMFDDAQELVRIPKLQNPIVGNELVYGVMVLAAYANSSTRRRTISVDGKVKTGFRTRISTSVDTLLDMIKNAGLKRARTKSVISDPFDLIVENADEKREVEGGQWDLFFNTEFSVPIQRVLIEDVLVSTTNVMTVLKCLSVLYIYCSMMGYESVRKDDEAEKYTREQLDSVVGQPCKNSRPIDIPFTRLCRKASWGGMNEVEFYLGLTKKTVRKYTNILRELGILQSIKLSNGEQGNSKRELYIDVTRFNYYGFYAYFSNMYRDKRYYIVEEIYIGKRVFKTSEEKKIN